MPVSLGVQAQGGVRPREWGVQAQGASGPGRGGVQALEGVRPREAGVQAQGGVRPCEGGVQAQGGVRPREEGVQTQGASGPHATRWRWRIHNFVEELHITVRTTNVIDVTTRQVLMVPVGIYHFATAVTMFFFLMKL